MNDQPDRSNSSAPDEIALADALLAWLNGDISLLHALGPDDRAAAIDLHPWLTRLITDAAPRPDQPDQDLNPATEPVVDVADQSSDDTVTFLGEDPIAVALGLVIDPDRRLSASQLRRARKATGLKPSEVANRLIARGWDVTVGEVARWEQTDHALAPALVNALSDVVRARADVLMPSKPTAEPTWLRDALSDERIARELDAWAQEDGSSTEHVRRHVVNRLALAGYRDRRTPTVEALLAVIAVLRQTGGHARRQGEDLR